MKKRTFKQNIALIGVILIAVMILATLITAFVDPTGRYFRSCLIVTIALPIALWVFMWAYGAMMHKHTPASFDLGGAEKRDDTGLPDDPDEAPGLPDDPDEVSGLADGPDEAPGTETLTVEDEQE